MVWLEKGSRKMINFFLDWVRNTETRHFLFFRKYSQNSLSGSFLKKTKYVTTITQQLYSWAFISEKWKLIFTQHPYENVHSNFDCDSWKLETIQMSFNECMVKHTVVPPYYGILAIKVNY